MVVALIAAALAAVFVVWTTYMALKRTNQAGEAQDDLMRAKDTKLATDLRDKDLQIATLTKQTEDERTARVQLVAKISWVIPDRTLIPGLTRPLLRFTGQPFTVLSDFGDPERTG